MTTPHRDHDEERRTDMGNSDDTLITHVAPSTRASEQSDLIPDVAAGSLEPEGNAGQEGEERPQELRAAEDAAARVREGAEVEAEARSSRAQHRP